MKRLLAIALVVLLSGCADELRKHGKTYKPYGVFNQNTAVQCVDYQIAPLSVVGSILFVETIIVPVLLVGWYLWEPINTERCG